MERGSSLPYSQELATCSYPEPDQSSPWPSHVLKNHFNIILPFARRYFRWSLSLTFPHQNPVCTCPFPHTCYVCRPFHSSWLDHPNSIGEEYRRCNSSLCSLLHSPVTSSLLGPNIFLSTDKHAQLMPNTLLWKSCCICEIQEIRRGREVKKMSDDQNTVWRHTDASFMPRN
jgi:hypothetical protein